MFFFRKRIEFVCILSLFGLFQRVMAQGQQSVSFQDGISGYNGTRDTWIEAAVPSANHGGDAELYMDGSPQLASLLYWDLGVLQSGSIVQSVDIDVNVVDASSTAYELYELKRPWIEGEATWNEYASGQSWQTAGVQGSGDRGTTVLGAILGNNLGSHTTSLNAAGVAVVQSWVDDPASNHGFVILDYSNTNGLDLSSSEAATVSERPKITVVYTPPPGVTVISPNGGEIWEVGSIHDITWDSPEPGGTVTLEYSTDNGSNWSNIISSTEDDGIEPWTVPATSTSQALVRISDTEVNGPSDVSDGVFTITSVPTLIVISPNGGEEWEGGSVQNITWNSLGTSGAVKIEYSEDNGFNWNEIDANTPDDGAEPWMIPDISTSQALVRISDYDGNGPSDYSDAVFTITPIPSTQGEPIIFSVTGDVPYSSGEIPVFQQQIANHNRYSPSEFFVHLGDIQAQSTSCPQSLYSNMAGYLMELAVPVFIVPGDNETTDCGNPAQAWAYWVQYFMDFELNFCGAPFAERQSVRPENFAFISKGVLFIGINLVSHVSNPIVEDDADWVEQQFQDKVSQVRGAVIFSQSPPSQGSFDNRFLSDAQTFAKPVLFIHGDGHSWEYEYPYGVSNVLRVQVDNGGAEEPVQVTVTMDDQDPEHMFIFLRDPLNPPLYNVMPCVQAGSDQQVDFPSNANLQGKATDDGVPTSPGTITTTWSKISGPGIVNFNNPNNVNTTASFSRAGNYVLRLTADDGAMQNFDELAVEVRGALVEAKIFLEGPYNGGTGEMSTSLNTSGYIPVTSPYSEDPRTVSQIPPDVTDWVLVQLRGTASGPAVASKSVLLRKDGRIVADNGITPAVEMDAGTNSYYIVIMHRNHLAVMSANPVQLSAGSSTPYDFTTGSAQYYGGVGAKELQTGIWGMWSGDIDQSRTVDANDRAASWNDRNKTGYFDSDCKLSGTVDANSRAITWNNRNKISNLP